MCIASSSTALSPQYETHDEERLSPLFEGPNEEWIDVEDAVVNQAGGDGAIEAALFAEAHPEMGLLHQLPPMPTTFEQDDRDNRRLLRHGHGSDDDDPGDYGTGVEVQLPSRVGEVGRIMTTPVRRFLPPPPLPPARPLPPTTSRTASPSIDAETAQDAIELVLSPPAGSSRTPNNRRRNEFAALRRLAASLTNNTQASTTNATRRLGWGRSFMHGLPISPLPPFFSPSASSTSSSSSRTRHLMRRGSDEEDSGDCGLEVSINEVGLSRWTGRPVGLPRRRSPAHPASEGDVETQSPACAPPPVSRRGASWLSFFFVASSSSPSPTFQSWARHVRPTIRRFVNVATDVALLATAFVLSATFLFDVSVQRRTVSANGDDDVAEEGIEALYSPTRLLTNDGADMQEIPNDTSNDERQPQEGEAEAPTPTAGAGEGGIELVHTEHGNESGEGGEMGVRCFVTDEESGELERENEIGTFPPLPTTATDSAGYVVDDMRAAHEKANAAATTTKLTGSFVVLRADLSSSSSSSYSFDSSSAGVPRRRRRKRRPGHIASVKAERW